MAKTKRYNGEEESLTGADRDYGGSSGGDEYAPAPEREEKPMTFKEAFASARKAGDGTFTWQGKKYTTELASEKKASAPKAEAPRSAPRVEAPKATPAKSAESSAGPRVGRAGQASAMGSAMREPDQEKMDMANLKRIKQREDMSNIPLLRAIRAIRERGESGPPAYAKGGKVGSASKRADGIATKGKTKCKMY